MSNTTIGTVQVILSAQHQALVKGMNEAGKAVKQLRNDVASVTGPLKAAIGAWLGVQGLKAAADFVKSGMDSVVTLQRQADQLGITTEAMAGLNMAATQAGIGQEQFGASMAKLQQVVAAANVENQDALDTFRAIGVSVADLRGKNVDQQFALIADKMRGMGDASSRTAAAMKLFGEQGRNLLPVIESGSEGLKDSTEEASKLGLALSGVETRQVTEAQKALTEAGEAVSAVGQRFAVELSPYITAAANAFISAAKESGGFKDTVISVVEWCVRGAVKVYDGWLRLGEVWQALRVGVTWLVKTVMDGFTYMAGLGENYAKVLVNAWGMISSTAVAAWKFIKSAFMDFIDWSSRKFANFLAAMGNGLNAIKEGMGDGLVDVANRIAQATGDAATKAGQEWTAASAQAKADAKEFASSVTGFFTVNLDEVGLGDTWQKWRANITDNYAWELNKLREQNDERIAAVAKAEEVIAAAKSAAIQRAEIAEAKAAQRRAVATANSEAQEAERIRNRMKLLDSAGNDPRVKYEQQVLAIIKDAENFHTLDEARAAIAAKNAQQARWMSPGMDPRVAYEEKVAALIAQVQLEQAQAARKRDLQNKEAYLSASADFFGNVQTITAEAAKKNEAAFIINRAAAMAQAEVSSWLAYANILGQSTAYGGPLALPFAEAMAATALIAGQVAVANIANQSIQGSRANGGFVSSGGMYEVNERGPEVLSVGDKSYLMMGNQDGHVQSAGPGRGASPQVTVNVHNAPGTTATVRQSGSDQAPRIDVIIERVDQAIASGIRSGSGATSRAIEATYGNNRARGAT